MTKTTEAVDVPELETLCSRCDGAGGEVERGTWYRCSRCDGAGYVPTDVGKRLLALVRHNFHLLGRDVRNEDRLTTHDSAS